MNVAMLHQSRVKFLMLAISFLFMGKLYAQEQKKGESDFLRISVGDLMSSADSLIQSGGSNIVKTKNKQPVSISTISHDQLLLSGARTLMEAIMIYVPGFFMVEDQDDVIAGFRGLAPDNNSKVLLLINGESINTEFFWGPAEAILNSTDYLYIERVEVIRGPGSVTLGQGALLGVINIVTNKELKRDKTEASVSGSYGLNKFEQVSTDVNFKNGDLNGHVHTGFTSYEGQEFRNEGWAKEKINEGFKGGTVYDMGHRLKRSKNFTTIGKINYKNFNFQFLYADHTKDLYNFYRDRDQFQQQLTALNAGYNFKLAEGTHLKITASYAFDNFVLHSLSGPTMGGTREDRYGLKALMNFDHLFSGNKLALGAEFRRFEMGKRNTDNNNFIANVLGSFDPSTANDELTMGYRKDINVSSLFAEDFYTVNNKVDVFLAFRYDNHPFWGNHLSPRVGTLININNRLRFRLSYQSGFRGAVGLHYTGGYRRDGHLASENFDKVSAAGIPGESNIPRTKPERMDNFELATNYSITDKLSFELTSFYGIIGNVIDVGVIYQDPSVFKMVNIGTDIPGDWNGYWYFKNTPGNFSQYGFESALNYKSEKWNVSLTNSLVKVASTTVEQRKLASQNSSMYLADHNGTLHFKAFPESVTRLNTFFSPGAKWRLSLNALYYSAWYSPMGSKASGGFLVNLGTSYSAGKNFLISINCKNLLNETALYPMNSNPGGPAVSPGTPALETTTFWLRLQWSINQNP